MSLLSSSVPFARHSDQKMHSFRTITPLLLAGVTAASYICVDFDVPMSFNASLHPATFPEFKNQHDSVQFLNDITQRNAATGEPSPLGPAVNVSVDVTVAAQYCSPTTGTTSSVIQVLTHGLGFDHSYWDFGGPDSQYNYIKTATEAGYSTLSYDRIGTGNSTKTDPYTTQQLGPETVVLATLTTLLREGKLSALATSHIPTPSKVVHVGHSFGSIISETLAGTTPALTDGVILTGFSTVDTYGAEFAISSNVHIAAETDPARFGDLSTGYVTWGGEWSNQYSFFHYPNFDPAVLKEAEATKVPFAVAEFLTAVATKADAYEGPVLVRKFFYLC